MNICPILSNKNLSETNRGGQGVWFKDRDGVDTD